MLFLCIQLSEDMSSPGEADDQFGPAEREKPAVKTLYLQNTRKQYSQTGFVFK